MTIGTELDVLSRALVGYHGDGLSLEDSWDTFCATHPQGDGVLHPPALLATLMAGLPFDGDQVLPLTRLLAGAVSMVRARHPAYPEDFPKDGAWLFVCMKGFLDRHGRHLEGRALPANLAGLASGPPRPQADVLGVLTSSRAAWHIINLAPKRWVGAHGDGLLTLLDMASRDELTARMTTAWDVLQFLSHPDIAAFPTALRLHGYLLRSGDLFAHEAARSTLATLLSQTPSPIGGSPATPQSIPSLVRILSVLPSSQVDWAQALGRELGVSQLPSLPPPADSARSIPAALSLLAWMDAVIKGVSWMKTECDRHAMEQSLPSPSPHPLHRPRM